MPIIAVVNQKGGAGKSTVAVHLARWLHKNATSQATKKQAPTTTRAKVKAKTHKVKIHLVEDSVAPKLPVIIVDSDAQRSSSTWIARLQQDIPCQVLQTSDELLEELPKLSQQYDWVIVDGPAALSEVTRAIVLVADLALVPCQPTGVDLESASDTVRLLNQAQRVRQGDPKAALFVNRAVKGTRLKDEALEVLQVMPGVTVLNVVVHQRQILADAFGQNATVFDLTGSTAGIARRELESLFKDALEVLNG
jgi:chromosome partitioning protein